MIHGLAARSTRGHHAIADRRRATVVNMAGRAPSTSSAARWWLVVLVAGYLLIELVGGAPDSPLVPALPAEVRVPGWTARGARVLGFDRLGRRGLTALALVLVAAVVCAFLLLAREAWRGRVRVAPVLVAGIVALALSVAGPLLLSRDVYSYAAYGRMFALHHANPYSTPPAAFPADPFTRVLSPQWVDARSVYGPAFTLVSAGIGRLFRASPAATIQAFKLLSALALVGATLLAAAACRKLRPDRTALTVALIALNPVLMLHTVGGGHSDALAALLLAGALWCVSRPVTGSGGAMGRSERFGLEAPALSATVLLALASSIKVALVVGLVVWLWVTLRRAGRGRWLVAGAAHLGLAVAAGAAVAAPLWAGRETFGSLETLGSLEGWASGVRLVARGSEAVARAVAGRSAEAMADHLTRAVFYVVFAAAVVWMLERARPPSIGHAFGASLLLLALAIPILLPWYSAWFILFLPFLSDDVILWAGVGVGALLALTGIPAEPAGTPALWRDMVLFVHYAVAPLMLGLLAVVVIRVFTRTELAPLSLPPSLATSLRSTDDVSPR